MFQRPIKRKDIALTRKPIRYFNDLEINLAQFGGHDHVNYLCALLEFHNTYLSVQKRYESLVWLYKDIWKHYPYDKRVLYCLHKLIDILLETGEVNYPEPIPEITIDPHDPRDKVFQMDIKSIENMDIDNYVIW